MPTTNVTTQGTQTSAGTVNYNPNNGAKLSEGQSVTVNAGGNTFGSTTNPVSSSTSTRSEYSATGRDIAGARAESQRQSFYQAERNRLALEGEKTIADINKSYAQSQQEQATDQASSYASRATGLVTSGGGFLGATQSQEGVLQNLKGTFEREKNALLGKRDSAVLAAQTAYADKDFAVAKEMMASARSAEKEMYQREQDYNTQTLNLARENRAQTEFDMGVTDKKIASYAAMSDKEFALVDKGQTDSLYYPGFTQSMRDMTKKAQTLKTTQDAVNLQNDILTMTGKVNAGQKFQAPDGKWYVGTKSTGTGLSIKDPIPSWIAQQLGAPNIAGMSQSDIILSLNLNNPPAWYMSLYKSQNPQGYEIVKNNPAALKVDWDNYKQMESWTPFKNTVKIDKVTESGDPLTELNKVRGKLGLPPLKN